jgi:hypothetical protein
MFGTCKCGKPNIGNLYGGTPRMCGDCFNSSQNEIEEKKETEKNDIIIAKAKAEAKRLNISLAEAILLVK